MACTPKYGECNEFTPCCDALYGCWKRSGRNFHQCRPLYVPCESSLDWKCPDAVPPAPPFPPLPDHLATAAAFARALGPGINIMAASIRWAKLSSSDYAGLSNRVGHVRLCGDLIQNLIDWNFCPGRTWKPTNVKKMSEEELQAAVHEKLIDDPFFAMYKDAAQSVLDNGMQLVLDPLHEKFTATLDESLLRRHALPSSPFISKNQYQHA